MTIKTKPDEETEISIFDEAIIYKRGEYWHFRMWLNKERRYLRQSLRTKQVTTAKDLARKKLFQIRHDEEVGRRQFSKTAKEGVEDYLKKRREDVTFGEIKKGRFGTIQTHLSHWLDFIGRDTKLRELKELDCEGYSRFRIKKYKNFSVSKSTLANEQSTINAMMGWLFHQKEVEIPRFEFPKIGKRTGGKESVERGVFSREEILRMKKVLNRFIEEASNDLTIESNFRKLVACYYLQISMETGLRRGEALQLRWSDITFDSKPVVRECIDRAKPIAPQIVRLKRGSEPHAGDEPEVVEFVRVTVRAETSKVGRAREIIIASPDAFYELQQHQLKRSLQENTHEIESSVRGQHNMTADSEIFQVRNGKILSFRAIDYWFSALLENAEIEGLERRNIVPYSFRHTYITNMVNAGRSPVEVAEVCGTSLKQITDTYYHTTEQKRITNAFPDYYYVDGVLYSIGD